MALHGDISINGHRIAIWEAQRIHGGTDPDDINTYRWRYITNGPIKSGELTHRFGDGAVVLTKLVMEAISEEEQSGTNDQSG